jgi:hypothetical protein
MDIDIWSWPGALETGTLNEKDKSEPRSDIGLFSSCTSYICTRYRMYMPLRLTPDASFVPINVRNWKWGNRLKISQKKMTICIQWNTEGKVIMYPHELSLALAKAHNIRWHVPSISVTEAYPSATEHLASFLIHHFKWSFAKSDKFSICVLDVGYGPTGSGDHFLET